MLEDLKLIEAEVVLDAIRVSLLLLIGLPLLVIGSRLLRKVVGKKYNPHLGMLLGKAVFYGGMMILLVMCLHNFGFKLTALLGTAGVLGVGLAFASQTSMSNIISGLFVIGEKPFAVGDVVTIDGTTGIIFSIDLMSIKLRTMDNRLVRIPNERIIKTEVTNVTRFPIRRYDIKIGVAYKEDVGKVIRVLKDVADKNPYCLDEPEPIIIFQDFGDSSLNFLFGVWFAKAEFLTLRNSIMREIKERFDQEGIEIPFPHRTLYAGSVTDPFPVRVVADTAAKEDPESKPSPSGDFKI